MTILFCNIGWMERYQGLHTGDQIRGGGAYVKKHDSGYEICNFSSNSMDPALYGYVRAAGDTIDLSRLGSSGDEDSIGGITVVWTATRPTGGTTIVGWYKDATVFRHSQKPPKMPSAQVENGIKGYRIKAPKSKAVLLPVDARVFAIPRQQKGGMGQSNIWYADKPESASIVEAVRAFIAKKEQPLRPEMPRRRKVQNQERKVEVEKAAIRVCCAYFEDLGYAVKSVERDNVGWDLEASSGKVLLRVEVKGLSGTAFSAELTPNEYKAFSEKASDYRLAVVTSALESPLLSICRYSDEESRWVVEGKHGIPLEIQLKESASISCSL